MSTTTLLGKELMSPIIIRLSEIFWD